MRSIVMEEFMASAAKNYARKNKVLNLVSFTLFIALTLVTVVVLSGAAKKVDMLKIII